MPPRTAIRLGACAEMGTAPNLGITWSAGRVRADGAVLVASVTRLVSQGIGPKCLFQRVAQAGIRRFDEDRANKDAAIGHDAAVMADELRLVEIDHHFLGDAFLLGVTAATLHFGAQAEDRQNL